MNGTDVLLLVNTGTIVSPVFTPVGSQRGLKRGEQTAAIDMSSKDARERRVLPGRYSSSLTFEALYVPDDVSFQELKAAMRNGQLIKVRTSEDGLQVEEADGVVTKLDQDYPDQEGATVSAEVAIDGAWTELTS